MDCIILAGNRENYREVSHGDNKAFLQVGGRMILQIIMDELRVVEEIDRLLIVGPKTHLEAFVAEAFDEGFPKPVLVFEQKRDLVSNLLAVIDATNDPCGPHRYVLVLPADIPLVIAKEIREFIEKCDMQRFDYEGGITTERALSRFGPSDGEPGIEPTYFYCNGVGYRINNIHMVRPSALRRMEYIRKTYAARYQNKLINTFHVVRHLASGLRYAPTAILYYLWMQWVRFLHRLGWYGLARFCGRFTSLRQSERHISKVLGTRFHLRVTSYGGSAIDVDNAGDYQVICQRFEEWRQMQEDLEPDQ